MKKFSLLLTAIFIISGCSSVQKQGSQTNTQTAPPVIKKMDSCVNKMKLEWDKNQEPDVKGYKIYFGDDLERLESTDVGNKLTYDFKKPLEKGKLYYFAITAYDSKNVESPKSEVIAAEICKTPSKLKSKK